MMRSHNKHHREMTRATLRKLISAGEDSGRQFKVDVTHAESLASEMAAFANTDGGTILIGVADDGSMPGLSLHDVSRVNQSIGNAASHLVRSPLTVRTENVALETWPDIDFTDDRDGCLFTATVHRKPASELRVVTGRFESSETSSEKSSEKILRLMKAHPSISAAEIGRQIGITPRAVEKQLAVLRKAGVIRRIGPAKGGHWEVIE